METEPDDLPTTESNETPEQNVPPPPGEGWVSLKDFVATPGTIPPKLRFPGGDELQPSNWRGLLIEVAEWLIRDGVLTQDRCPVTVGKNAAYSMVNCSRSILTGKTFTLSSVVPTAYFWPHMPMPATLFTSVEPSWSISAETPLRSTFRRVERSQLVWAGREEPRWRLTAYKYHCTIPSVPGGIPCGDHFWHSGFLLTSPLRIPCLEPVKPRPVVSVCCGQVVPSSSFL